MSGDPGNTNPVSYGAVFPQWRAAAPDWAAYTHHLFVEGLKDGSLPRAAFLHYLRQDYVFLIHFSRAWALAVVKAGSLSEMKACAGTVDALVNHEMALHVKICAEAGISEAELEATEEAQGNLAYTRYVMDAGLSGDFADMMAALAPCVMGYGEIGARLASEAVPDTPYRDWIETYGGTEYQGLCADVGTLIDGAMARRVGGPEAPRWNALQQRFNTATKLEVGFWDMGLAVPAG